MDDRLLEFFPVMEFYTEHFAASHPNKDDEA